MPFIEKQDRTERVDLKEKIRPEVKDLVIEYAAYLESEVWWTVQELLRKGIASDKEFQASRRLASSAKSGVKRINEATNETIQSKMASKGAA